MPESGLIPESVDLKPVMMKLYSKGLFEKVVHYRSAEESKGLDK